LQINIIIISATEHSNMMVSMTYLRGLEISGLEERGIEQRNCRFFLNLDGCCAWLRGRCVGFQGIYKWWKTTNI